MATILDVEEQSGVSRSTISRYLNGKNVSEKNRIKIEQAIEKLSFQRNPIASGLRSSKTLTVGCVVPDLTHPFFPMIVQTFQQSMQENGYQTIINSYGYDEKQELDQVRALANKRVDGLVVVTGHNDGAHIRECLQNKLPVVLLDCEVENLECDSVTVDNYNATYDAISLAIRKGHRDIGYMRVPDLYTENLRFKAYCDALSNNGIPVKKEYIVKADVVEHDATRQFMRLLNMPSPPSLIFCSNAYVSLGALEAMMEYHLSIPRDVSVITFDRLSAFPYFGFVRSIKPEFSSICQPLDAMGKACAETLLKRIDIGMEKYNPIKTVLKTSFYNTETIADIR